MRFLTLPATLAAMLATGCATAQPPAAPPADAPPAQQLGNTPPEDLDPFVVMIGAERWTVILDRATEGAMAAPYNVVRITDSDDDEGLWPDDEKFRADVALKRGAAQVIILRNIVCEKGWVTGDACELPPFPAWTHELPSWTTSLEELDQRSAWLSEVMDPFTSAGCEAGRKATSDDMFCSVE